ncbi:MAG: FAD binding domain-containing protein [Gaiellales bacterium]
MDVVRPSTLDEALRIKAELPPEARFIQGGTDVMVELNFAHSRPPALVDLNAVAELRGWRREGEELVLGAGLTHTEAMHGEIATLQPALAAAARTVGSPQIRNRGTLGGNLGTASPAGDALPPLLVAGAMVELRSVRGERVLPLTEFLTGVKRNALAFDELVTAVRLPNRAAVPSQTFMKVGTRNAMVIAVCSLAVLVDRERDEVRAAFGSAAPVATLVRLPLTDASALPEQVVAAASPIDDVRGTAAYRRHALGVLAGRALSRCLA